MMRSIHTILAGIDFSPCSAAALREAVRLARLHNGQVHAVHIVDLQIALEMQAALTQLQEAIRDGLIADARQAWKEFLVKVPDAAGLEIEVSVDHRVYGLLKKARDIAADLIVLGAYGKQRPDTGAGTLATEAVRMAGCDVLLVRDTHQGPFSSIVAGVDFSDTSRRALERAAQIAAHDRGTLYVVHVFTPPWDRYHYRAPTPQADPHFMARYKSLLNQRLQEFVKPVAETMHDVSITCELSEAGGHRSGIVEYAERVGADLICLGTRGQSNLRDFFLGSTAEKALLHSKCSVFAVKPDGPGEQKPAG